MALHLLRSALPKPELTEVEAIALIEYHLQRNGVARQSHTKSWNKRHRKIKYKVLL